MSSRAPHHKQTNRRGTVVLSGVTGLELCQLPRGVFVLVHSETSKRACFRLVTLDYFALKLKEFTALLIRSDVLPVISCLLADPIDFASARELIEKRGLSL